MIKQLRIIFAFFAVLLVGYLGVNAMEKNRVKTSNNELFNQLIEIMENSVKKEGKKYYRDLTNVVCPLVSIKKLTEMMQDDYIKSQVRYFEVSSDKRRKESDSEWWIDRKIKPLEAMRLYIIINRISNNCEAYLKITI